MQQSELLLEQGQVIVQATQQGLVQVAAFDTKDGLYDCAWSEVRIPRCI